MVDSKGPEAFRSARRPSKSQPARIEFVLPGKGLFLIGLSALLMGLVVLHHPRFLENQPGLLVKLAGWGGVLAAVALFYLALSRQGSLVLDARTRNVRLEFRSPKEHTVWMKPFAGLCSLHSETLGAPVEAEKEK